MDCFGEAFDFLLVFDDLCTEPLALDLPTSSVPHVLAV